MPTVDQAGQLATGLLIHKGVEVISLGSNLAINGNSMEKVAVSLLVMGISGIVGILIGMSIAQTSKLLDCIFMCIAGGMLLFIACSEIIVHEF
jgi:zinc transporter ZupT